MGTSSLVSRSTRVSFQWPTPTESLGARDSTDSPRDAPSTTSRAPALPSGDLSSTSPLDQPRRPSTTALMASPDTPPSPRTTVSSQLSSQRSCLTVSTTLTPPLRSPPRPGPRPSSTLPTRTFSSRESCSSLAWSLQVLTTLTRPPQRLLPSTP